MVNSPLFYVVDEEMIEVARNKCYTEGNVYPTTDEVNNNCPRVFDGWSCWNETPAGHVVYGPCPSFILGFDSNRFAHKTCMDDGQWFRHPESDTPWSNYTSCVDTDDLALRQRIINIYIVGYSVSVVALVFSIAIFFSFKALRCTRITIHKNLFLSFIINNSAWILWYTTVIKEDVLQTNPIGCQMLHVFLQYFLVCNYFWMFCEGLYLHTLLVFAFINEEGISKWFYVVGWVIPAILTIVYASVRSSFPEETTLCWSEHSSPYTWILKIPVCISMLTNLIFLINIVRVLVTKLRAVNSPDVNQTRKAVRATLILIPLLGLHYLVTPFRPDVGSPAEEVYEMISAMVTSFQGLCVACLFCFFNGEVLSLIMRRWSQKRAFHTRSYSIAGNTTVSKFNFWTKLSENSSSPRAETEINSTISPEIKLQDVIPHWW